jgi:MFS-type transporter involved in bile tolerance (Atg22 family)
MQDRRKVLSWALYDWANSAFATTVMTAFFLLFLKQYWSGGADAATTTFRLGFANAVGGIVIALLAPVLGAIADQGGTRKRFLIFFTAMAIVMTGALPLVARGEWPVAIALYVVAVIGFSGSNSFYDSLLVSVAAEPQFDRVSSLGFALGYLGGGLLFAVSRRDTNASLATALLAIAALASVLWWRLTDIAGAGDLRPYALVQGLPLVLIPVWHAVYAAPRDERLAFAAAILLYVAAKAAELNDEALFSALGRLSGHTVKHLLATASSAIITFQLTRRLRMKGN